MPKWTAIGAVVFSTLPAVSTATGDWKPYSYPELGFSIKVPAPPEVAQRPIATGGGPCPSTILTLAQGPIDTLQLTAVD